MGLCLLLEHQQKHVSANAVRDMRYVAKAKLPTCCSSSLPLQLLRRQKGAQCRFAVAGAAAAASRACRVSPRCAAAAMTEIMKTQVELALQNRHVPPSSQAEPAAATGMAPERSKAEKLQDAMEAEAKQRTRHIHDDRKRKFNSLDAGAKEVTGGVALLPRCAAVAKLFSWSL